MWTLTQDQAGNISGSVNFAGAGCPCGAGNCGGTGHNPIWVVVGKLTGSSFTLTAINPATGDVCTTLVEVDVTIAADGITAEGYYLRSRQRLTDHEADGYLRDASEQFHISQPYGRGYPDNRRFRARD